MYLQFFIRLFQYVVRNLVIYFKIRNIDHILSDTSDVPPQKRHKKHKHKKHKKKKLMHDDSDTFVEISTDTDRKKSFRIKMKKEDERRYTPTIMTFL